MNHDIKVYLAQTTSDADKLNNKLQHILKRAGFDVCLANKEELGNKKELLNRIVCSIHLIGNELTDEIEKQMGDDFEFVREKFSKDKNFNIFIWYPEHILKKKGTKDSEFLTRLRNSIYSNMIFSNHESPVMFVEDIRNVLYAEKKADFHVKKTDIFFLYNALDNYSATEIIAMLSDISSLETLKIDSDNRVDYSQFIAQQVSKSSLTVVYFKDAVKWAVPFMQQIWKISGGASIKGEFLLIASKEAIIKENFDFDAPKTSFKIVADELIPLEIKVILDRIIKKESDE